MLKKIKKILLVVCLLIAVFTVADFALALDVGLDQAAGTGLAVVDPRIIVANIIRITLGFLGIIAVGLIIYAGWIWMTAAGSEEKIEKAKKILINAVIGLVIILASFAIASFILSRLIAATSGGPGGGLGICDPACATGQYCCSGVCQNTVCVPGGGTEDSFRISSTIPRDQQIHVVRNVVIKAFFNKAADTVNLDTNFKVEKISDIDPGTGNPTGPAILVPVASASREFANGGWAITFKDTTACGDEKNTPNCFAAWSKFKVTINGSANPLNGANGLFSIDGKPLSCSIGATCQFVFSTNNLIDTSGPQAGIVPAQICKDDGTYMKPDANTVTGWGRDDVGISGLNFYQQKLSPLPVGTETQALVVPGNKEKYQSVEHTYLTADMTVGDTYKLRVEAVDLAGQLAADDFSTTIRPGHCCNGIKDGSETDIDCGGVGSDRCGACDGAACASDISIPTNNNNCSANNNLCASQFCTSQNSGVTSCQDAGYAAGTPSCCICQRPPVITGVFPVGGFCDAYPGTPCLKDGDCPDATCNKTIPNGAAGNFVTITGRNFGTFGQGSKVVFLGNPLDATDDKEALFPATVNSDCKDSWSDTQIIAIVPTNAINGPVKVEVAYGFSDDSTANPKLDNFLVNNISRPGLCKIDPVQGVINTTINYYGVKLKDNDAYFGNSTAGTKALGSSFTDASGKQGTAKVPNIQSGRTTSFVAKGLVSSNYLGFTKEPEPYSGPVISSFDPTDEPLGYPVGQYVTINGRGFGNKKGASEVYFGDSLTGKVASYDFPKICADSIWSDKQVIVKVPSGITDGRFVLTMKIAKASGGFWDDVNTSNLTPSEFIVKLNQPLRPSLCKINPVIGKINSQVSLYGEYFGAQDANSKVRFQLNKNQMVFSYWAKDNDLKITGIKSDKIITTVPDQAITGPVKVVKTEVIQGIPKELVGNGLNFKVGVCQNTAECGSDSLCCSAGTPYAGQCKAGTDSQAACFPEINSCVYEWNFSTAGKPQCLLTQTICGRSCCNQGETCDPNGNNGYGRCDSINCSGAPTCGTTCCDKVPGATQCDGGVCPPPPDTCPGQVKCNIPGAPAGSPSFRCCNIGECNLNGTCDSCPPNKPAQCTDKTVDNGCCSSSANCRDTNNDGKTECADLESCSGYGGSLQGCYGQLCPNSPGQCSTKPEQTNVDTGAKCDKDVCLTISRCRGPQGQNLCSYNSAVNKCLTPAICDFTKIGGETDINGKKVDLKCDLIDNKKVWYYDSRQTCANSYTKSLDGSKCLGAVCDTCDTGLVCAKLFPLATKGICAVNQAVCPADSKCVNDKCIKNKPDSAACECCCDIGQNTPAGNPGCCTGLSCGGTCGADISITDGPSGSNIGFGQCTGCANAGTTQEQHNDACNCTGTSGKFCDTAGAGGKGVCKDCAQLSTAQECSGLGAGACCVDNKNKDACRGGTAPYASGTPGDTNKYCAYYSCGAGNQADQCQATPLKNGSYRTTTCDNKCVFPPQFGESCAKIATSTTVGTCDANVCAGFSCLNADGYGASNPGSYTPSVVNNTCGICCCRPGTIGDAQCKTINTKFTCIANKGSCSSTDDAYKNNRGLCCGCAKDSECGNAAATGCGSNTCCQARPSVVDPTVPANGATNVCRNALIQATFNEQMQINSFVGNVIVAADYENQPCPAGTEYLTAIYKPTIFAKIKSVIARIPLVNKLIAKDAWALPGNFCAVQGSASGYNTTGDKTVLEFKMQKLLEPGRKYYVIIKGDSDVNDALSNGVLSQAGIGMSQTNTETFNGVTFKGKIWSFTTMGAQAPNNGVCTVDHAEIAPVSYLFQTNKDDAKDNNAADISTFDKIDDSDLVYRARAVAADGSILNPLAGVYNWTWGWSSAARNIFDFAAPTPPSTLGYNENLLRAKSNVTEGKSIITATATLNAGGSGSYPAAATAYLMVCTNPWPAVITSGPNQGTWVPWNSDSTGNCVAGSGICPNTSFEVYYCRDAGGPGTADDLPAILSDNAVIRGTNLKCRSNSLNCDDGAGSCTNKSKGDTCSDGSGKCDFNVIGSCPLGATVGVTPCGGGAGTCQIDILKELYLFREGLPSTSGNFTVSVLPQGGAVLASWPSVTVPAGVTGYKVYYGTASGKYDNSVDVVAQAGAAQTKEISGLTNGRKYYFAFTSLNDKKAESAYSNEIMAIPADTTAPVAPSILWLLPTTGSTATIGWRSNSDDTASYKVYYGATSGALGGTVSINKDKCFGPGCVATVTNLNSGTKYYFAVTALDAKSNESNKSPEKSLTMVLASRAGDLAQLAQAFYRYAGDHGGALPNYGVSCLGVSMGQKCWNGYTRNLTDPQRNVIGIPGNTVLNDSLAAYISEIPFDPRAPRTIGDAYIYFQGTVEINCGVNGNNESGNWLAWEPDKYIYTDNRGESFCEFMGRTACCGSLGCSPSSFCVLKLR